MIKAHLFCIIATVSIFLITVQFISLQVLIRNNQEEPNHIWNSLYRVTSHALNQQIPLFLIDKKILEYLNEKDLQSKKYEYIGENYCRILCRKQKITHLATLGEFASYDHFIKLIKSLKELGFTVLEFSNLDPNLLQHDIRVVIPLHLLIFSEKHIHENGHIIHISVFHERIGSYWWISAFEPSDYEKRLILRQGSRGADFLLNHDLIFPKFEIYNTIIDGLIISLPSKPEYFISNTQDYKFIQCNKTRAKIFNDIYGFDNSASAESFKTRAKKLLLKVKKILDQLNVPFWLSSGTCLGYFRQCDFISYSNDVDIGIWIKDYNPYIVESFMLHNFPLIHVFGKPQDSFELSFQKDGLKLDIFFFYEERDYVWNGGTQAKSGLKYKYIFPKFKLCWSDFLDQLFRIPCDTLSYIEANYGKNWSIPIKEWDWKTSPSNVKANGIWPIADWKQVIQLRPELP